MYGFIDTSCILAWLIEEGYEVYAFMADVGQEEVRFVFLQGYHSEHSFIGMAYRTLWLLRKKLSSLARRNSSSRYAQNAVFDLGLNTDEYYRISGASSSPSSSTPLFRPTLFTRYVPLHPTSFSLAPGSAMYCPCHTIRQIALAVILSLQSA